MAFRLSTLLASGLFLIGACERSSAPRGAAPEAVAMQHESPKEVSEPPQAKGQQTLADDPILHRTERKIMGTIWSVTIAGGEEGAALSAAETALDEVVRLDGLLSEWKPDSEISRVNDSAGIKPQVVGPELLACIHASLEIAKWSDGAFDISWAAMRDLWDFSATSKHIPPSAEDVKERLVLWNYRNIQVDEAKKTVFLKKKGMQIGLGGVAKGYALDRMGEILRARGFANFLAFAGGQILIGGKRGSRSWRVGIQHPREQGHFGFVEVSDCSVATSGDYEHSYTFAGERFHHIIDPKTGFPSRASTSVTVIAKTALSADAVDTALFIMGPERGLSALKSAPGGPIEAVMVGPDLRVHVSEGVKERLSLRYALDESRRLLGPLPRDVPNGKMP